VVTARQAFVPAPADPVLARVLAVRAAPFAVALLLVACNPVGPASAPFLVAS